MFGSILWLFKIILSHEKKYACLEMILMLAAGVLAPASVLLLSQLIDAAAKGGLWVYPLILYIGTLFVREGILALRRFCGARVLYALGTKLPEEIIHRFDRLPYRLFEESGSRDVLEQVAGKPSAQLYELYQNIGLILSDAASAAGYLFVVGQVHWLLSAGYLFFLLFNMGMSFRAMRGMADLYDAQTGSERRMDYLGGLLSDRDALAELKTFQAVPYLVGLWRETADKVIRQRLEGTGRAQAAYGAAYGAGILWMGLLAAVMVESLTAGRLGIGTFISVLNGAASLTGLAGTLSGYGSTVSRRLSLVNQYMVFDGMREAERLAEATKEETAEEEIPEEKRGKEARTWEEKAERDSEAAAEKSGIVFDDVSFAYPGSSRKVLDHLCFQVKPGETLALVGENGAGKSTVLKLLCRLYEPTEGRIFLDGRDIRSFSRGELGRRMGVAFQDFFRYSLTVRENVALGNLDLLGDEKALERAFLGAKAEEFLECLDVPLGKLEEDGRDFSGGQWQRLAVARALFGEKPYIILDEPTAAIDPAAESGMYEAFRQSLKGRTGIVVSHRLASAAFSDRILVLEHGQAAELGTHQELLAKKGIYAHMWQVQSRWYEKGDGEG